MSRAGGFSLFCLFCLFFVSDGRGVSRSGAGIFRVSGRDLLVFVSDGPLSFNSERKGGKNASKNYVFAFPQRAIQATNGQVYTTRLQNRFHIVPYDELTSLLRRCRSCGGTVEQRALFGVGISGSGAVAETVP